MKILLALSTVGFLTALWLWVTGPPPFTTGDSYTDVLLLFLVALICLVSMVISGVTLIVRNL